MTATNDGLIRTAKEQQSVELALDFIKESIVTKHRSPTLAEWCNRFNLGTLQEATQILCRLEQLGLLKRDPNVSYGIRLTGVKVTIEDVQ
jgi:SOS-response transcriptional repressor LexA